MTLPTADRPDPPRHAPRTARAVARRELTGAITASARQQLAEVGPAQLSVRAVARELGMASSAVYRYFPSRDDLLTALLVIIYNELADVLDQADIARYVAGRTFPVGGSSIARAMHSWAQQQPHDFAFLYGSPVPGYTAPEDTVAPSGRVTGVVLRLLHDIHAAKAAPAPTPVPRSAHQTLATFRQLVGFEISDDLALRGLTAWGGLLGALTLELFGHLHRVIDDYDAHFDIVAGRISPI